MNFIAELPPGYDERARLTVGLGNTIVVVHPELPAIYYDEGRRVWVRMAPGGVEPVKPPAN